MNNFEIKINILRLLGFSRSLKPNINEETILSMIESFASYILEVYIALIEEAINSSRYEGEWEPVGVKEYEEYLGTKPEGDILSKMREALEVGRLGYNHIIRFDPRYRYPGSKIPFIKVLRVIENGTSGVHARPILKKIVRYINSNLIDLWRGYLTMKGVV